MKLKKELRKLIIMELWEASEKGGYKMDDKRILIINGKTEDQIIEQIIGLVNDDELGDILNSYEDSPGLNELIENMSAFFTVQ